MKVQAVRAAAPGYAGGKLALTPWIAPKILKLYPQEHLSQMTLVEPFFGAGGFTIVAKALSFKEILANDYSDRSQIVAAALHGNNRIKLDQLDLLWLNQDVPEAETPGYIETHHCPSVFSTRHAKALDRWLYWARQAQEPTKRALYLVLIWRMILSFVCFPTSLGSSNRPFAEALDGLRSWEQINPKRFIDGSLDSLLRPTLELLEAQCRIINQGIFGGAPVKMHQMDALAFLRSAQGDMCYMDPPYAGTLNYTDSFAFLDELLFGRPTVPPASDFSTSIESLHALLDAAQHIPVWVLSYGNKEIDLDGLLSLVKSRAGNRRVFGHAKHYAHMPHVSKRTDNQELLIIAIPE